MHASRNIRCFNAARELNTLSNSGRGTRHRFPLGWIYTRLSFARDIRVYYAVRERPAGERILIASRANSQVLSACLSTRLSIQAARKPCQINTRKSRIAASLAFDPRAALSYDVGNRSLGCWRRYLRVKSKAVTQRLIAFRWFKNQRKEAYFLNYVCVCRFFLVLYKNHCPFL